MKVKLGRIKTFGILGLWSTCVIIFLLVVMRVFLPRKGQNGMKGRGALGFPLKKDDIINSISHKFSQQTCTDTYYLKHEVKVMETYIYN